MVYILIILTVVLVELKIKNYIEEKKQLGCREELLNGKIILRKHYNRGIFLNYLEDKKEMVKTVSSVVLGLLLLLFTVALTRKGNKLYKFGLALALGGAISNVWDRIYRGYVIDYFSFNYKKLKTVVFNLADMAILLGSFLIAVASILNGKGKSCSDKASE